LRTSSTAPLYVLNTLAILRRRPWSLGPGVRERTYLITSQDFDGFSVELAAAVASAQGRDVHCQVEQPKKRTEDVLLTRLECKRASWMICIDPVLLDKFFNGAMGLRAQYYVSPYYGALQNARLLLLLREALLQHASRKLAATELATVRKSLAALSAKVWICEKNLRIV
jgi:hypothetical protein